MYILAFGYATSIRHFDMRVYAVAFTIASTYIRHKRIKCITITENIFKNN